jgi:hopanoid biosynthesis associated protein HpnK
MKVLIVNGDDFGLTPGVNAGILDAHRRGILTSASLFANAPATGDAIAIARRTPTLGVGCHLTLVDGTPILPAATLPTLAPTGRFRLTWRRFIQDALGGRIRLAEVEQELEAQVQRLSDAGVALTHLDSHKHVHAYPPVFRIVARLARQIGVEAVRVPHETPAAAAVLRYAFSRGPRRQAIENLLLTPWSRRDRAMLAEYGLPPAPRFTGRALTGFFTRTSLEELLASLADGTTELMTHPGYPDAALDDVRTRLRRERAEEAELLMDGRIRSAVTQRGIVLKTHSLKQGRPCQTR